MRIKKKCGLTLNDKCDFGKRSVKFLGHLIEEKGVRTDPRKVNAIVNMPDPKSVTDVRRFLGMANQLGKFSPQLAVLSTPLRDLLRKDVMFVWRHKHEAFHALKRLCSSTESLCFYDFRKETIVSADASSYGLGSVLLQKQGSGEWKPVTFCLTLAQRHRKALYAQIEKKALAAR